MAQQYQESLILTWYCILEVSIEFTTIESECILLAATHKVLASKGLLKMAMRSTWTALVNT